jgi:hypothetical protein
LPGNDASDGHSFIQHSRDKATLQRAARVAPCSLTDHFDPHTACCLIDG